MRKRHIEKRLVEVEAQTEGHIEALEERIEGLEYLLADLLHGGGKSRQVDGLESAVRRAAVRR